MSAAAGDEREPHGAEAPWVYCARRRLSVARADSFEPPARFAALADTEAAVGRALAAPLGAPRLRELARGARRVVVTIPDASRPCPSPTILRGIMAELEAAGVPREALAVAIGCGLHAVTDEAEKERLTGLSSRDVALYDAQGHESETADLGVTSLGAPVRIERRVAEADLVVTAGVVEPHLYAGFSGGVKGVAIGCAGHETIAWTHHPTFISGADVVVGRLQGNPFQETIRELAGRTALRFAVNAVMDAEGSPVAFAAGDPVTVQASLAAGHGDAWLRAVDEPFDVVVLGVHAPKSDNFYQASRAATYAGLAARPALAAGGLFVVCADLSQGAGEGPGERNFAALMAGHSPAELVARGLREPLGPGGQRAFVVARLLQRFRLAVVGAADPAFLEPLGAAAFDTVDAALAAEDAHLGRRARVLAVADAMATVVSAR